MKTNIIRAFPALSIPIIVAAAALAGCSSTEPVGEYSSYDSNATYESAPPPTDGKSTVSMSDTSVRRYPAGYANDYGTVTPEPTPVGQYYGY